MHYHDTHFHLDLVDKPEVLADQIEKSCIYTIAVTNSPSVFQFTEKIALGKKYLRAALGLHPELAFQRSHEIDKFIELSILTKYIGEIGLDNFNKAKEDYHAQKKVFEKIIDTCATQKGKILTIHSRKAEGDVLNIIGPNFPGKIILHWYSGNIGNLERAVEYGCYFSINYSMTISAAGKNKIIRIPDDRILIETDGPFTEYKSSPSTPLISRIIMDQIVKVKKAEGKPLAQVISNNFKTLLLDK